MEGSPVWVLYKYKSQNLSGYCFTSLGSQTISLANLKSEKLSELRIEESETTILY